MKHDEATKPLSSTANEGKVDLCILVMAKVGHLTRPLPEKGAVVIGRGAECDLTIDEESVSRAHARITRGVTIGIEDLGSTNGTKVGGHRLAPGARTEIQVGTILELGDVLVLVRPANIAAPIRPRQEATPVPGAVFVHESMKELYGLLEIIGPSDVNVLVLGETGVGKDVFASAVHTTSSRGQRPFVRINCAALAESLLEAELFGFERGAFTGASQAKAGLFESAEGGTVFLDEIGEMPLTTQAKLLRVVENREVTRIGSLRTQRIDVRIVAATNRDLAVLSELGQFRADLYYRLAGVSVVIPPLRRRPSDLPALARHFLGKSPAALPLTAPVEAALAVHRWPGNVRELKSVLERALLLARGGPLTVDHLRFGSSILNEVMPASTREPATVWPGAGGVREAMQRTERDRILATVAECDGNHSEAARRLGISRTTLLKRLAAYGKR